ncbi:diaminopropionate ammonia-lyase [Pseudovibrio sp. Tun.PSC04-5.I4]|uniref:diaminopropionate ammonia-lyase n=1 Tax=Pseudovibrio sp. Tun.PSC04-5.I4 TaxID=1798213 RepID=UPI0008901EFC|nr:diaminopropionate ammonia-lyase [Pseudovibrio sp. Tun.PSC04-5.I4]SDQ91093.1 diaminopropionate ammonia-lyase [Pseudovibrio sp. Tun.PSC04-5.I4]
MLKSRSNRFRTGETSPLFTAEIAQNARKFHSQIEGYEPTPLTSLPALAAALGVKGIYVKDESYRFGLNAFKVLGGSYALGRLLAKKLDLDICEIDLKTVSEKFEKPMVFATATAGNHGTGVAWAARAMGQKAVVYMPKGSPQAAVERIRGLGADCIVTAVNYDNTVRIANKTAEENGWELVQDTAWDGYEEIPTWISQGYMTMAGEAADQLAKLDVSVPTHVMLQAGVGAMAGGVLGYLADAYGSDKFTSIISEPRTADCLYRSVSSETGEMTSVEGDLSSIMAGLACGEPNPITWPILRDCGDHFASATDNVAATGMRILGNPLHGDAAITGGESGALNIGLLYALKSKEEFAEIAKEMDLSKESVVLIFNTEGDTNPERYRKIVWEGALPL